MHFTAVHTCVKLICMREVTLVAFFFRCKTPAQQNHKLLWWPKVVSHERTDETSPMSLTPEEPFSEETVQAIADCVVKQLQRFVSSC